MRQIHKELLSVLGYLYLQNGNQEKAFTIFAALCELFPEDVKLGLCLGYIQVLRGDYSSAVRRADRFLGSETGPEETAMGLIIRGRALWGIGRRKEARAIIDRLFSSVKETP